MASIFKVISNDGKAFDVDVTAGVLTIQVDGTTVLKAQQAAIASLTHAFGTADGTVADVSTAFDQAILNNNFKEVTTNLGLILTALRAHGIIAT